MPTRNIIFMYHFLIGKKIVETGLSMDIQKTDVRLRAKYGKGKIREVYWRTTPEYARAWLKEQKEEGKPVVFPKWFNSISV